MLEILFKRHPEKSLEFRQHPIPVQEEKLIVVRFPDVHTRVFRVHQATKGFAL